MKALAITEVGSGVSVADSFVGQVDQLRSFITQLDYLDLYKKPYNSELCYSWAKAIIDELYNSMKDGDYGRPYDMFIFDSRMKDSPIYNIALGFLLATRNNFYGRCMNVSSLVIGDTEEDLRIRGLLKYPISAEALSIDNLILDDQQQSTYNINTWTCDYRLFFRYYMMQPAQNIKTVRVRVSTDIPEVVAVLAFLNSKLNRQLNIQEVETENPFILNLINEALN